MMINHHNSQFIEYTSDKEKKDIYATHKTQIVKIYENNYTFNWASDAIPTMQLVYSWDVMMFIRGTNAEHKEFERVGKSKQMNFVLQKSMSAFNWGIHFRYRLEEAALALFSFHSKTQNNTHERNVLEQMRRYAFRIWMAKVARMDRVAHLFRFHIYLYINL